MKKQDYTIAIDIDILEDEKRFLILAENSLSTKRFARLLREILINFHSIACFSDDLVKFNAGLSVITLIKG